MVLRTQQPPRGTCGVELNCYVSWCFKFPETQNLCLHNILGGCQKGLQYLWITHFQAKCTKYTFLEKGV